MDGSERATSYRELKVWQRSLALALQIYKVTEDFPRHETYGLCSQIRRAVVSVPSNIAEGNQRDSVREYLHFVSIALGSLAEVETQLLLSAELQYVDKAKSQSLLAEIDEIGRMLHGIQKYLRGISST
jgi:four helix bundle protein